MTPKSVSSKKYPDFIRTNLLFKVYKEPSKVFAKIGLDNCQEDVPSSYFETVRKEFAAYVAKELSSVRHEVAKWKFSSSCDYFGRYLSENEVKDRNDRRTKLLGRIDEGVKSLQGKNAHEVNAQKLYESLASDAAKLLEANYWNDGPKKLVDEGQSKYIDNLPKNASIVCSSRGQKAYWDIATMSMRGTKSCQRWDNENHRQKVIGTMIDPNAAILYLETDDKTKYGSKMIRRSVVRLVINKETGKKMLLIERVYPHSKEGYVEKSTFELFKDFVKRKTNNKFDVVYGEGCAKTKYYIPLTPQVEDVNSLGKKFLSYRDSHVEYLPVKTKKAKKKG